MQTKKQCVICGHCYVRKGAKRIHTMVQSVWPNAHHLKFNYERRHNFSSIWKGY